MERFFLADPRGTLMVDIPALEGGIRGKNSAHRQWYQGVSQNWQPYVSPVYQRTAIPQRNVFAVAIPVKDDNDNVLAILILQLDLEEFFIWMNELDPGPGSFITVIDSLAHTLGLSVIAEGVETMQQKEILKQLQCDQWQGFLFSEPVLPKDIESMLWGQQN